MSQKNGKIPGMIISTDVIHALTYILPCIKMLDVHANMAAIIIFAYRIFKDFTVFMLLLHTYKLVLFGVHVLDFREYFIFVICGVLS